ncbi:unnamed protein product [Brassica oleracea]
MSSQVSDKTSSANKLPSPSGITTSFVSPCGGIGSPNQSSKPPTALTSSVISQSFIELSSHGT